MSKVRKLKSISFANAVRLGVGSEVFVTDEKADIELHDGMFVKMTDKHKGKTSWSSLLNAMWWNFLDDEKKDVSQPKAKGRPKAKTAEEAAKVLI
jgi:vancomycin resistance protein YoaR